MAESELQSRVDVTPDQCVVDEKSFFIRGHIILPIVGRTETFEWSVWCSLSETSFLHASERWFQAERVNDAPYFGWLFSKLPCYPDTLRLKTDVKSREVGVVPEVILHPADHPLYREQQQGISWQRVLEFAHEILHVDPGGA